MAANWCNKFNIQVTDVVRLTFIDEKLAVAEGLPSSQAAVGENVMSRDNARALANVILETLKKAERQ